MFRHYLHIKQVVWGVEITGVIHAICSLEDFCVSLVTLKAWISQKFELVLDVWYTHWLLFCQNIYQFKIYYASFTCAKFKIMLGLHESTCTYLGGKFHLFWRYSKLFFPKTYESWHFQFKLISKARRNIVFCISLKSLVFLHAKPLRTWPVSEMNCYWRHRYFIVGCTKKYSLSSGQKPISSSKSSLSLKKILCIWWDISDQTITAEICRGKN